MLSIWTRSNFCRLGMCYGLKLRKYFAYIVIRRVTDHKQIQLPEDGRADQYLVDGRYRKRVDQQKESKTMIKLSVL